MGAPVPQSAIDTFKALRRMGLTNRQIAASTGYNQSTIGTLLALHARKAPDAKTKFQPRFWQTPPFRENDEEAHLAMVFRARPEGFPVAFSRAHYRVRAA